MKKNMVWKRIGVLFLALLMAVNMSGCSWIFDDDFWEDETTKAPVTRPTTADSDNETPGSIEAVATGTQSSAAASGLFTSAMVRDKMTNTDTVNKVTVLVYMNGSNLETDDQEATTDLSEMVAATHSSNVNILVQTMGTKKWASTYGISAKKTQRYQVTDSGLKLVDDSLKQLDCTDPATLLEFINWGKTNYPADRYILIFWNHGGGPVYGFGYDEWNEDSSATLSLDEMQLAINNSGVKFDFIGMDCCIMSCLETGMAFYDYCDYTILSEEFESGLGWSYTGWLSALAKNPSIHTEALAKIIIDDMVSANEKSSAGDSSTLACIDEAMLKVLYTAWIDFAYANEETLLNQNYSTEHKGGNRAYRNDEYSIEDYFITDMMALAGTIPCAEADALASAVNNTIVYYRETADETVMTGLAVTLPYGDSDAYATMASVFRNCGFDETYINWLGKFVSAQGFNNSYDYSSIWDDIWSGWDDYDDDYDWFSWDDYDDEDSDFWDYDNWGWVDWLFGDFWDDDWEEDYWDDYWNDYDDDFWDSWDDDYYWDDDDWGGFWDDWF